MRYFNNFGYVFALNYFIFRMVVIHIKRGEGDGFLYETSCETSNDVIIRDIVRVYTLLHLCCFVANFCSIGHVV